MNRVIMNYGFLKDDQFVALPVHLIDQVLCNFSFIRFLNDGARVYDNELGDLKENSMKALGLNVKLVEIKSDKPEIMSAAIREHHEQAKKEPALSQAVLYLMEQKPHHSKVFHETFGTTVKKPPMPIPFEELDIMPQEPFFSIPMELMFQQTPAIRKI